MGKKSSPRALVRAEFRRWLGRRRRAIAILLGGSAVWAIASLGVAVLVDTPVASAVYVVLGLAAPAAMLGAIVVVFFVSDPRAVHLLRGAWGEDNTRDELKRLRRRHTWGHLDSIVTQQGDVDHVVFLRRGGVVAIDSKWRSAWSDEIQAHVVLTARRSCLRARGLITTQLSRAPGRHRGAAEKIDVTALAVVWGPAQEQIGEPIVVDGVHVVAGSGLRSWVAARSGEPLERDVARELRDALAAWDTRSRRLARDAQQRGHAIVPRS